MVGIIFPLVWYDHCSCVVKYHIHSPTRNTAEITRENKIVVSKIIMYQTYIPSHT